MERGKVWTCNIIYIGMFPKYWNLLNNMMLNYWTTPLNNWTTPLNYWTTPLNNYIFLVRGATKSPRNGRAMPPFLSPRFGKAGGPTASDPEPRRGGGSDLREGQDSLPCRRRGETITEAWCSQLLGSNRSTAGLGSQAESITLRPWERTSLPCRFPPSHKKNLQNN